jgi:hypothetical protein
MKKPTLDAMIGIWEGQLVSDSAWSPPLFRFRYYRDKDGNLKNDYLFGGRIAGTASVQEKEDHVEMQDITRVFHDEIRQVNDNILIGKYYSETSFLFQWLPEGLGFLHIDKTKSSAYLPYILKRIGAEEAFRGYK